VNAPADREREIEIDLYCMTTLLADEASRFGRKAFSRAIEEAGAMLLAGLPRVSQIQALHRSYEASLGGEPPAPAPVRLVYSRD
jgi:transposase InsO family protein